MENNIILRKATINDIVSIHEIESKVFENPFGLDMLNFEIDENPFGNYFVLLIKNKIVGFIGFWFMYEDAQITNVAILPEYRKKGFGEMLVNYGLDFAKDSNVTNITLEVRYNNCNAINLYKKLGFSQIGIRKNYYPGNIDALLMQKKL